jgi:hypothetical protein
MERNAARPWIVRDLSVGEIAAVLLLATFVAGMLALQLREREPVSDAAFVQNYLLAEIPQIDPPGAAMRAVAVTSAVPETQDGENLAQTDIQLAASIIGQRSHDNGDDGAQLSDGRSDWRSGQQGSGRDFGRAFGSGSAREPVTLADRQRLLDVDFDLGAQGTRAGDLQIGKPVSLNGRRVGVVAVSIDRNSQLHLSAADLGAVLPEGQAARLPAAGGFVSFDALRASGFDIRYDPVGDVLMLNLPTRS